MRRPLLRKPRGRRSARAWGGWSFHRAHLSFNRYTVNFPAILSHPSVQTRWRLESCTLPNAARCCPKEEQFYTSEGPSVNTIVKDRRLALEKGLEGSSITIAKTLAADWTEEGAKLATIAWLQQASASRVHPDLICSQNDAMALGVQKAARAQRASWAGIPALGCDGVPTAGQLYVKEGTLAATVIKPVTAGPAVDWIVRSIRGEKLPHHLVLRPTSFPAIERLARRL